MFVVRRLPFVSNCAESYMFPGLCGVIVLICPCPSSSLLHVSEVVPHVSDMGGYGPAVRCWPDIWSWRRGMDIKVAMYFLRNVSAGFFFPSVVRKLIFSNLYD